MRVVILCEALTTPRYWNAAIRELESSGASVTFATTRDRDESPNIEVRASEHFSLGCRSSRDYPVGAKRLRRFLKSWRADVLHASEPIQGAVGGFATTALPGTACVYHRHHASSISATRLSQLAALTSKRTIAVSEATARHARLHDIFNRAQIRVVANGLPDPPLVAETELRSTRATCRINEGDRVILAVGRLRPEKGHRYLIEAMPAIQASLPQPTHLVLVGDGPERDHLERIAGELGVDVRFMGHQFDVQPWYALADLVAIPSIHESFGLVALEAMASSLPVVATTAGGLPEIVAENETGLLVSPGDSAALARAVIQIFGTSRTTYGAAGRQRFEEHFSAATMVAGWMRVYREVAPP